MDRVIERELFILTHTMAGAIYGLDTIFSTTDLSGPWTQEQKQELMKALALKCSMMSLDNAYEIILGALRIREERQRQEDAAMANLAHKNLKDLPRLELGDG